MGREIASVAVGKREKKGERKSESGASKVLVLILHQDH